MAAGDTPEVLAKIDLLIELVRRQDARIDRLEAAVGINTEAIAHMREYIAEFRGEVRGRLDGMSERISDVNARLPIPIAYAPPNKPAAE